MGLVYKRVMWKRGNEGGDLNGDNSEGGRKNSKIIVRKIRHMHIGEWEWANMCPSWIVSTRIFILLNVCTVSKK
jgi:hypothetical protein